MSRAPPPAAVGRPTAFKVSYPADAVPLRLTRGDTPRFRAAGQAYNLVMKPNSSSPSSDDEPMGTREGTDPRESPARNDTSTSARGMRDPQTSDPRSKTAQPPERRPARRISSSTARNSCGSGSRLPSFNRTQRCPDPPPTLPWYLRAEHSSRATPGFAAKPTSAADECRLGP
jgi:hypothetical protein